MSYLVIFAFIIRTFYNRVVPRPITPPPCEFCLVIAAFNSLSAFFSLTVSLFLSVALYLFLFQFRFHDRAGFFEAVVFSSDQTNKKGGAGRGGAHGCGRGQGSMVVDVAALLPGMYLRGFQSPPR